MDYAPFEINNVFSGDTIAGNCFSGVCEIAGESLVTVEYVLRIATICPSYIYISSPFPIFFISPFLFYFLCYFR
jgi:hypothetical protein